MIISLELLSSTGRHTLRFRLRETAFAKLWSVKLRENIEKGLPIRDEGRFVGLSKGLSEDYYCGQINLALKIINQFSSIDIDPHLVIDLNQQKLNFLHDKFDELAGPRGEFIERSPEVQVALECMNESIHSLENIFSHRQYAKKPIPYIYTEFQGASKLDLPSWAYSEFSLKRSFGDLFIHYSQVGKSILEVFEDNDEQVDIRPLECYNGSFDIRFRGWSQKKAEALENEVTSWMKEKSLDQSDDSWALGWLVVADLLFEGQTEQEILSKIEGSYKVLSVSLDGE